ncbi:MAG: 3-deoxy-D-manno-octulosonic acid transferase [Bacteroidia bacterium]|nr:3-deoxy-D-manno-octulosonic acid transferase [Bacteroidia bacterium]
MYFFYNIAIHIASFILNIIAFFNKKIGLFVNGRKGIIEKLESHFKTSDKVIWFHCASLGEFEQGRPIIESCKKKYKDHKMLVTFFSPSGYEIRKDYADADLVCYLPLDTKYKAKKFVEVVNPKIAIFVKYEFWPNLLRELKTKKIETILISGIFRRNQAFFKWYGGWMNKSLETFNHFFVQNSLSERLLNSNGFKNVTISGDTRFDRVNDIMKQDIVLDFADKFKDNKATLVAGSTWAKDEEHIVNYINGFAKNDQKFIIAPHNIEGKEIEKLKNRILKKVVLFSEKEGIELSSYQVLIIDTIGLLSKIYNYADIAYVGGGFGAGIHNILEPATFGVPIIIGPNYKKFAEAVTLVELGACRVINSGNQFEFELNKLFKKEKERKEKGKLARKFVQENTGATQKIMNYLGEKLSKKIT